MATLARERVRVALAPARAEALWADVRRWPSFVEGFRHALEVDAAWPDAGSRVVWESGPGGRGRVTERVLEREPAGLLVMQVFEDQLAGEQRVSFEADGDGAVVTVELEYELVRRGPLRAIANALFIRRAISDALARTLRRFAVEAAEEASLSGEAGARGSAPGTAPR